MSNLDKCSAPLLSVLTMVKFETAPSLSLSPAALLVLALMFAATFLDRGLALPGLGPSCVDATLFLPIEDGPAVSITADTTWFVVGPLASAGENDGVATVFQSTGWAAETVFENHAVLNSEDMSVLPYLFTDDEIVDALPLLDFGSSVCRSLLKGRSCSIGRMSVVPLRVVFSIVSSVRAIQMLAALAFPFCFQFLLAAFCAAMLVVSCLLFSGIERVPAFKFPLLLDPGFFEHVAHVWKGKLAKDESEENVSLLNSGAKGFQVPSCGILDGFLLAPGVREFWKERHWSIMAVSEVRASLRRRRVGTTRRVRRAALRAGALSRPAGRRVRAERSEAGSDFASQFCPCDPPLVRLNRVNDIICVSQSRVQSCLSQNSHSTSARSLHAAHNSHARMSHARCVVNSVGDTEDGGRSSCVHGRTKALRTSTLTGVRRPAVEKLASPQQASLKLHEETWAGLLQNQGLGISQEVEIVPGCAVRVACPSCTVSVLGHLGQAW